ncbi:MAG: hypothetical protein PVI23_08565 [Maricaulaceae bacterium]
MSSKSLTWAAAAVATFAVAACAPEAEEAGQTSEPAEVETAAAPAIEVAVTEADFGCIRDMEPVRGFYVANVLGDLEATLAVANSETGGTYPPGSLVQLVPSEAMLKREPGYSPDTNDWEFFELVVSDTGTAINVRGTSDAVNRFGGNCRDCHVQAQPQWDMICEQTHGCAPIPITPVMSRAIQKTDPRCDPAELTEEESAALAALMSALGDGGEE